MQCIRETDVIEAMVSGRSSDQFDAELRSHAASCDVCREVIAIASSLREDYTETVSTVRVPSASLVWWRAELRLRRDSIRAVDRPITLAHAFAAAASLGVLIASLVRLSPWFRETVAPLVEWSADLSDVLAQDLPVVLALGAVLVLAPVALYFVFSDR